MLLTVGDLVTDVVVWAAGDIRRGSDTPSRVALTRGGSAANVAVAAAYAGVRTRFVGQVGDDDRGHALVNAVEAAGVDARVRFDGETGTIVVLVDAGGERSFLTDRGASSRLSTIESEVLDEVTWLHIPGYSFLSGPLADACHRLIGEAVDQRIPISLSTSSVSALIDFGRQQFLELIEAVQPAVVVSNGPESEFLIRESHRFPATTWSVITRGGRETIITHANGEQRRIAPPLVEALDSTGAGDAFTGGFIASLLRGSRPLDAVRDGHQMAARTLKHAGARLEA